MVLWGRQDQWRSRAVMLALCPSQSLKGMSPQQQQHPLNPQSVNLGNLSQSPFIDLTYLNSL